MPILNKKEREEVLRKNRLGSVITSKEGRLMKVIRYGSKDDIDVLIMSEPEYILKNKKYIDFKMGLLEYPFHPKLYGVGYYGVERGFATKIISDKDLSKKSLNTWRGMMVRCYNERNLEKFPTYREVTVCSEWHDYRNFAEWFLNNYYVIDDEVMELDKDIMSKDSLIYSPETCVFVTKRINSLFIRQTTTGNHLPFGVYYVDQFEGKVYRSKANDFFTKKPVYLSHQSNPMDAFRQYKEYKEMQMKQVADLYKDKIPEKLYLALYNYDIKPTDSGCTIPDGFK